MKPVLFQVRGLLMMNSIERVKDLQHFDNLKNKGLYVDYQDELLIPNNTITKEIFERTLEIAIRVFRFYKLLRIVLHEKAVNHIPRKNLDEIDYFIQSFINDALPEISFKELSKIKIE